MPSDPDHAETVAVDSHWTSGSGVGAPNRYDLSISAGALQVTLDENTAADAGPAEPLPAGGRELRDVSLTRELLLAGIERRLAEQREPGS